MPIKSAFAYCNHLNKVILPAGLTNIAVSLFAHSNIGSITIPETVVSIGNDAFYNAHLGLSITIPDSVKSIGQGAFAYNYSLLGIYLSKNVESIGLWAFYSCWYLNIYVSGLTSAPVGWVDGWNLEGGRVIWNYTPSTESMVRSAYETEIYDFEYIQPSLLRHYVPFHSVRKREQIFEM